jgi:rubrerythrin
MSIIWSLKRLFDPATYQREEGEQHAEREQPRHTHAGDPPRFEVAAQAPEEGPPPRFCCRVCGYESQGSAYCPECLADTMQPAGEAGSPAKSSVRSP